jgi:hypothetical protein
VQRVALAEKWRSARDLLSKRTVEIDVTLQPYEVMWLQHE